MRKSPLIIPPLILIGLTGAYALVYNFLPDTSEFPRVPTADGTIGGYIARILGVTDLANYGGDGTVENTLALSGLTQAELLKNMECGATDVWTGLNNGTPTCGADAPILAYLGTGSNITGGVTAYHADDSISDNLQNNDPIREGDIIQTAAGAGITITFLDGSVLRIDGGSTVSLDIGTTYDGQSIAYAILENGGLWGRVLTETGGYYIGNDDIIAGVRGTSVSLENKYTAPVDISWDGSRWKITKFGSPTGQLSVVHSRRNIDNEGGVVEITCKGKKYSMNPQNILYLGGIINCDSLNIFEKNITYLYETYPTIAINTIADLNYMSGRLAIVGPGGLTASQTQIFMSEFEETRPEGTEEKSAICTTGIGGGTTRTYWDSFVGRDQTIFPVCQDSSIRAYANYSNTTSEYKNLYQSNSNIFGSGTFDGANKPRLVYTGSQIASMLNRDFVITLNNVVATGSTSFLIAFNTGILTNNNVPRISTNNNILTFRNESGISFTGTIIPGTNNIIEIRFNKGYKKYTLYMNGNNMGYITSGFIPTTMYIGQAFGNPSWKGDIGSIFIK